MSGLWNKFRKLIYIQLFRYQMKSDSGYINKLMLADLAMYIPQNFFPSSTTDKHVTCFQIIF